MGLFKKKRIEPIQMTLKEAFDLAQSDFNADIVRAFQTEAPTRELYKFVEQIKGSIQRVSDMDRFEYELDLVIIYDDNADKLTNFFTKKGFEVASELTEINGKNSFHIELKW